MHFSGGGFIHCLALRLTCYTLLFVCVPNKEAPLFLAFITCEIMCVLWYIAVWSDSSDDCVQAEQLEDGKTTVEDCSGTSRLLQVGR